MNRRFAVVWYLTFHGLIMNHTTRINNFHKLLIENLKKSQKFFDVFLPIVKKCFAMQ